MRGPASPAVDDEPLSSPEERADALRAKEAERRDKGGFVLEGTGEQAVRL
jgi:hypothetical protein